MKRVALAACAAAIGIATVFAMNAEREEPSNAPLRHSPAGSTGANTSGASSDNGPATVVRGTETGQVDTPLASRPELVAARTVLGLVFQSNKRVLGRIEPNSLETDPDQAIANYLNSQMTLAGFDANVVVTVEKVQVDPNGDQRVTYRQIIKGSPIEYAPSITFNKSGDIVRHSAVVLDEALAEPHSVTPAQAKHLAREALARRAGVAMDSIEWRGAGQGIERVPPEGALSRRYMLDSGPENVGPKAHPIYLVSLSAAKPSSLAGNHWVEIDGVSGQVSFRDLTLY